MAEDFSIKTLISQRLGGEQYDTPLNSYKFIKIKNAKKQLLIENPNINIIDLGIGEPDLGGDARVVDRLYKEAGLVHNRFYADNGIDEFKKAAQEFLINHYHLDNLDYKKEIIHGIGTKSILSFLPHCFINPGEYTLLTVPGYPIIGTHTKYIGGKVYELKLYKHNNYYPDLDNIPHEVLEKSKILYINYPNNPTGQIANSNFYEKVVAFAKKNKLIVVSDAAYGPLVFSGTKPMSFLSLPGAMDVGIEIHSLSKAFNMTGWRLAFMAGNSEIIKAYGKIKSQSDSGQFMAIQRAGIEALSHPDIVKHNCTRYERRHRLLVNALTEVGFNVDIPKGTFYLYAPMPYGTNDGYVFKNAEDAASYILNNAHVSTVPWDDAGAFLRFSVTFEAKDEWEEFKIMQEVKRRLIKLNLRFKK